MRNGLLIAGLALAWAAPGSRAQATRPAPADVPALQLRATNAFNSGQYASALPIFEALRDAYRADPDKLGPVQEQIRVCEKQIAAAKSQAAAGAGVPAAAGVATGDNRKPHAPPKSGETRELEIKQLGNFEFDADKGGNIPADVKALAGGQFRLHGFMIPMDQAQSITEFSLVPSLFACCFGQPPQVQHVIVCHAPKGKAVSYYPDEIVVEGTLKVDEKKDDGFIVSVFEIDVTSVKPAAK